MGWVAVSLQLCGIWSWPAPTSADGRGKAGVGFQPAAGFWRRRMSAQPSAPGSRVRHAEKRCWLGSSACFSGHPGLWDVLPGRGAAAGEEAHRHRWDCLLWLPQGERHLPLPGREWDLSCERWRPPWIHREFAHLLSLCWTLLWQGLPLAWSESKEQIISSYCTGTGSDLDNPGNRIIHRGVFPWLYKLRCRARRSGKIVAARQDTRFVWFFITNSVHKKQQKALCFSMESDITSETTFVPRLQFPGHCSVVSAGCVTSIFTPFDCTTCRTSSLHSAGAAAGLQSWNNLLL